MCGICGAIFRSIEADVLSRAMDKMLHRGPDQSGTWHGADGALGHQRLSIIDLSPLGRQPMTNEDGSVVLVYNGEIYGFDRLRAELEPRYRFRSRTDSEVLVHGYAEWGIDGLLERVHGMFAFAIYDLAKCTLHLVRDHLGKKPLYWSTLGGGVAFASTLPALLELLGTTPAVSGRAVVDYLTYLSVPAPDTIFEGVHKLPPASRLEVRADAAPKLVRYWRPDFSVEERRGDDEWLERIDATLRHAVAERMIADVPVCAFLSGGVDSSLVVAQMTRASNAKVTTVSVGFADRKLDELPFARRVAEALGTSHHEHVIEPDATAVLPRLTYHTGEPLADQAVVAAYYLAQMAREHATVVLTGDGGDETFAGYHTTRAVAAARALRSVAGGLASPLASAIRRARERTGARVLRRAEWVASIASARDGEYLFDPPGARTFRGRLSDIAGPALIDAVSAHDPDARYRSLWADASRDTPSWVNRALYVDLLTDLPNTFLPKTDVATMAHSLEARCPLLDKRLVELACRIPPGVKLRRLQSKHLLKRLAERYVPRDVLHREKHGLSLPISTWLRRDLGETFRGLVTSGVAVREGYVRADALDALVEEHRAGRRDHGQRLWTILVLELWMRMFVEKELTCSDSLDEHDGAVRT